MSDSTRATSAGYGQIKTLAVRLSEDVRAQLDTIAQLNDRTVTDEIRLAIEAWIEKDQIDREAATKRGAIEAIFDKTPAKQKASPSTRQGAEKEGTSSTQWS